MESSASNGGGTGDDWLLGSIDDVERAGRAARDVMTRSIEVLEPMRRERLAGVPLPDIVAGLLARGGRQLRIETAEAWQEFERSVMLLRANVIRALVDEEGASLTEVAHRMGASRQMVSRLYHAAERGPPDGTRK